MGYKSQKKLMLLGGLRYLVSVIEAAHKQGYYVITCDNLPNNIAHQYSDEYYNASIIDKDAVLLAARQLQISGIMSFAVDPGVVTAAYVQEQMGLPAVGPYESVRILQNKDLFREFLANNGFNVPYAKGYASIEEALADKAWYQYPVMVKPTDSAGSKGCNRVNSFEELEPALADAYKASISKHIIVEEFIEKLGCSSDTDSFSIDGELKFVSFSAQQFDDNAANPYVPTAYSWPSTMNKQQEAELTSEIQRLLHLLKMKTSIFNIETRIGSNGKLYIMELSPRGGGNKLAEMLRYATGVDLIAASVRAAVGDSIESVEQKPYIGHWAEVVLHSDKNGIFQNLEIVKEFEQYVVECDLWVKRGDSVSACKGANDAIGFIVLRFDSEEELVSALAEQNCWCKIIVNDE